jgi:ribosomal protein L7/L12
MKVYVDQDDLVTVLHGVMKTAIKDQVTRDAVMRLSVAATRRRAVAWYESFGENKIAVIKAYRAATIADLKSAKLWVEDTGKEVDDPKVVKALKEVGAVFRSKR